MEERDATLACLAICEAAQASIDQARQRINEERQPNTQKDNERVISSLSELIGTDKPFRTSSKVDGDTASPSQRTNLAHRQRKFPPTTKDLNRIGASDSRGQDSEGEPHEGSFVMVEREDSDEGRS
jgi:hypothetical protein